MAKSRESYLHGLARRFIRFMNEGEYVKSGLTLMHLDKKQIEMGMKVEREHSDDPQIVFKIVTDHLAEKPDYYSRLKRAGL
jgi:hypothetical protein